MTLLDDEQIRAIRARWAGWKAATFHRPAHDDVVALLASHDQLRDRVAELEAERDSAYERGVLDGKVSTKIYAKGRAEERAAVVAYFHAFDRHVLAGIFERGEHITDPPPSPWSRNTPTEPGVYHRRIEGQVYGVIIFPDGSFQSDRPMPTGVGPAEWARATPPK